MIKTQTSPAIILPAALRRPSIISTSASAPGIHLSGVRSWAVTIQSSKLYAIQNHEKNAISDSAISSRPGFSA